MMLIIGTSIVNIVLQKKKDQICQMNPSACSSINKYLEAVVLLVSLASKTVAMPKSCYVCPLISNCKQNWLMGVSVMLC